ncbi:MAG: protein-glutamate O-methyltransferase CheR [Cellvibrionales bacterium]|nr:protein-glutamate O-methyltransferase CheR [Cellvibrionales bacterium]
MTIVRPPASATPVRATRKNGAGAGGWSIQAQGELSEESFASWRKLLEERTGIHLVPQQKTFLQSQLTIRVRELGNISFEEYFRSLHEGVSSVMEWSTLIDRLVVKETSFFRHQPTFDFLRNYINQRIANGQVSDSFDVWSVGCATGEEPYTLAMILDECFESAGLENYWGVTGMDISMPAQTFARQGIYSKRKLDMVPPPLREKYFSDYDQLRCRISEEMRERVCFTNGNVIELKKMPMVKMDIISCNNMLIYFRRWRRRKILNNLAERLKKGGILIIGLGEIVDWEHPLLEPVADDGVQAYVCVK